MSRRLLIALTIGSSIIVSMVIASYFQKGDQVKAGDELVEFQALEEVA